MKKYISILAALFILAFSFSGCTQNNEEILERLDALESQVALLNEAMNGSNTGGTVAPELSEEPATPTPEPGTILSYETITNILGKANVMSGRDDTFLSGELWISTEEFFIFLTYDCALTEDVLNIINQNLKQGYGAEYSGDEESFVGDGDLINFSENEDGTLSIGFELSSMDTAAKVYALDKEFFSSYDDFMISQNIVDEYGLPEPTHHFIFDSDGSIFTSLDWELPEEQAKQMAEYYTDQFSSGDSAAIFDEEFYEYETEGFADDGTKLILCITRFDNNYTVMIKRLYEPARP